MLSFPGEFSASGGRVREDKILSMNGTISKWSTIMYFRSKETEHKRQSDKGKRVCTRVCVCV
jgi:hypothetical protein